MHKKINTESLSAIEVYSLILENRLSCFPRYFWQDKKNAYYIINYLFDTILKWTDDDIKNYLCKSTFEDNRLGGMLNTLFNNSPYLALDFAKPGLFKPFFLQSCPKGYWNIRTGIEATKWLIEEQMKWNEDEIKENFGVKVFKENGLLKMLDIVFKSSPFNALNHTYPEKFHPWELKNCPLNYWTIDTAIKATKWLVEDILKWDSNQIILDLSQGVLERYGLSGMLQTIFNGSPYQAISTVYPEYDWSSMNYGFANKFQKYKSKGRRL